MARGSWLVARGSWLAVRDSRLVARGSWEEDVERYDVLKSSKWELQKFKFIRWELNVYH